MNPRTHFGAHRARSQRTSKSVVPTDYMEHIARKAQRERASFRNDWLLPLAIVFSIFTWIIIVAVIFRVAL